MMTAATSRPQSPLSPPHHIRASSPIVAEGRSLLRVRLGAALQQRRLRRGLTQGQLSELVGLSLKYVGEIERGEANTTLDVLKRLADVLEWDPLEAFGGVREPITEGVRRLLIDEHQQIGARTKMMLTWLEALDPALHSDIRSARVQALPQVSEMPHGKAAPRASRRRRRRKSDDGTPTATKA